MSISLTTPTPSAPISSNNCATCKEVRGRGLMVGVVMDIPHKDVRQRLIHEQHVFTGCAGTNILRILPPLIITKADVDDFIFRLSKVLKTM